jgi:hypothetical protein
MEMMLKSMGIDPKQLQLIAQAVMSAASDLKTIKEQQQEILRRLANLESKLEFTKLVTGESELTEVITNNNGE